VAELPIPSVPELDLCKILYVDVVVSTTVLSLLWDVHLYTLAAVGQDWQSSDEVASETFALIAA